MVLKQNLNTKVIYEAIYNLLEIANTNLPKCVYDKLSELNYKGKENILKNAHLAQSLKRPLCQDTGQVVIFLEIGQDVIFSGNYIEDEINAAVSNCYKEKFYRKSTVQDAVFNRANKGDNTPAIIHTKIIKGDEINILLGIKGGGAENMTTLKMFNPTAEFGEILNFALECAIKAGENACPPMCIGIGAGGCAETAALLAKKALFTGETLDIEIDDVFETKILTAPTHIASLPVCVNLSCHSLRHAAAKIQNGKIIYEPKPPGYKDIQILTNAKEINTSDITAFETLQDGDEILLSGVIFTARDAAHKRMAEIIEKNEILPFDLKDKILFYAGPCPATPGEIIGPIGPTTSKRMDKFAPLLYEKGVLATIGKGNRTIKGLNRLYFKAQGGIACVLQQCIKKCELVCFEDLGAEAIYRLEIEKISLKTVIL